MPFTVKLDDATYRTDDLTLAEVVKIEAATGIGWWQLNPFQSGTHARAVIVAFLARTLGDTDAAVKADAMTAGAALEAFDFVPDDAPEDFDEAGVAVDPKGQATSGSGGQ